MTDLHTHILPGMDDGASTAEESFELLRLEKEDGVSTVALTPHYYPEKESIDRFLARREEAFGRLMKAYASHPEEDLPRLVMGAEVAWKPKIEGLPGIEKLCYGKTRFMLLELPFYRWSSELINGLYDLITHTGITPVIAHIERYIPMQKKELLNELYDMGLPVQIGADTLLRPFGRSRGLELIRRGQAQLVASDCHDTKERRPCVGRARDVLTRKLGSEYAASAAAEAESILRGDQNSGMG